MDNVHRAADRWRAAGVTAIALLAGGMALLLLVPTGVLTSNPPQCVGLFTNRVPCGLGHYIQAPSSLHWLIYPALSIAAGLLVAVLVHATLRRTAAASADRGRHDDKRQP